MKFLPAVVFFLICLFSFQITHGQDSSAHPIADPNSLMQDTVVYLEGSFIVRNPYARKDSIAARRIWASSMHDTTIALDPAFIVLNVYAERDAREDYVDPVLVKRKAIRDSLNAIGAALLHTADMQDTTIALDPAFVLTQVYAKRDSIQAVNDSLQVSLARAATLQDTTIALDPAFIIGYVYAEKDRMDATRDSVRALQVQAGSMQDTTIDLEPAFIVSNPYSEMDRAEATRDSAKAVLVEAGTMRDTTIVLEPSFIVVDAYREMDLAQAVQDSLERPMQMQDTVIALDAGFQIQNLYPIKDSVDALRDSLLVLSDSLYADSVRRHWAGWKKFEIKPDRSFNLESNSMLKGKSKTTLQYNIADFYLYLNGDAVLPSETVQNFFAAACLGFRYDDTVLLNSGLGAKVGVGVGIKIFQGKCTSTLHANTRNTKIYKLSDEDSVYLPTVIVTPVTQSLILKYFPNGSRNEVLQGEYQATYKKFYQKNETGQDEPRKYTVRIIFRCRVSGGISSTGSEK